MHHLPAIAAALRAYRAAELYDSAPRRRAALRQLYRAAGSPLGPRRAALWWRFGTWTTRN